MTWVKICGTTNLEDALVAVEAGADAVGFVFYEKSPRCVSVETVREIVAKLPDTVEKVGVFVDAGCEAMKKVAAEAKLTAVQLHGPRAVEAYAGDSRAAAECIGVSKVIEWVAAERLNDASGVTVRKRDRYFAALVDHQANGVTGGTGETFDWEESVAMVRALGTVMPVVVAGGLNPENVKESIRMFEPWGVDVVSGVEARPGKKDAEKVRAFVRAVREMDGRAG